MTGASSPSTRPPGGRGPRSREPGPLRLQAGVLSPMPPAGDVLEPGRAHRLCLPGRPAGGLGLMQTFLPDPDFAACARVLDTRRLGKQRVEILDHWEGYAGS